MAVELFMKLVHSASGSLGKYSPCLSLYGVSQEL